MRPAPSLENAAFLKSSNKLKSATQIKVGKIFESKGLRGEVKVLFFSGAPTWIKEVTELHLSPKPISLTAIADPAKFKIYKIESRSKTSQPDRLVFKLEGVNDRNQSDALKGTEVFVDEDLFESEKGGEIYLREILGFVMVDIAQKSETEATRGLVIGTIVEFESNGVQDIAVVAQENGDRALVPLIKAFIENINFEKKIIEMNLPEGLTEINRAL